MTLNDMLNWAEELRPSAYSESRLLEWIEDLEAGLWTHIFLQRSKKELYIPPEDEAKRLLLPDAWRRLYTTWLGAMIDYADGEYAQYENEMTAYNACVSELAAWYAQSYAPADVPARWIRAGTLTGGGTLTLSLPAGAAVLAAHCKITEEFDGDGTLTLGTAEDPTLVLDETDMYSLSPGAYITQRLTVLPSHAPLLFAAPEDSTAGEAALHLLVQLPAG